MAYLAFSTLDPIHAENTIGDRPIVRHVTLGTETKAVLCGGFVRGGPAGNPTDAIAKYVGAIGGASEDWEVLEITLAQYDSIELAVYQPIRDAAAVVVAARKQTLRDMLIAQTVRVSDLSGTDRVWRVPTTVAEFKEFAKALLLAMDEVRDKLLEHED